MAPKKDPLTEYKKKRDFTKTPEPKGAEKMKKTKRDKPMFVIQKHDASRLHYDFRLEIDGVLVSWAIPKGPSYDPDVKRLAIQTEDHPLDYGDFEGVIPEGEYGAGTVMVWEIGTYDNLREEKDDDGTSMEKSVKEGKVEVFLHGKKLEGGFALIRTGDDKGPKSKWLFFKMKDDYVDRRRNPVSTETKSALSGKTMKEIEKSGTVYGE